MESLKQIYILLPMIVNALLSDKSEQNLSYQILTDELIALCRYINGNCVPMSHARLRNITTSGFHISLEALMISAFYHFQGRINNAPSEQETVAYELLSKAVKTLHIKISDPELLTHTPRAHVLKVLFNINLMNNRLVA